MSCSWIFNSKFKLNMLVAFSLLDTFRELTYTDILTLLSIFKGTVDMS